MKLLHHHRDIQLYDYTEYYHPKPKSSGSSNTVNNILQNHFLIHVSFRMWGSNGRLIVFYNSAGSSSKRSQGIQQNNFYAISLDSIKQGHKGALYTVHFDVLQSEVDIYLHCVLLFGVAKV
jgi:hypothetical protein